MKNLFLALIGLTIFSDAYAAKVTYVSIKGSKQGYLHGELTEPQLKNFMPLSSVHLDVSIPRDPNSGVPVGKRKYSPLTFIKPWSPASTQILEAAATNEILSEVVIRNYQTGPDGKQVLESTVTLTNASIVNVINQSIMVGADLQDFDTVSLVFQKIQITDKSGDVFQDQPNQ